MRTQGQRRKRGSLRYLQQKYQHVFENGYDGPVSVQDPVDIMNSQDGGGQSEAKTASSSNQHSSSTNQHQASSHASSNHSHSAAANENQAQAQINGTVVEDRKNLRNLPIEEVIEKTKSIVGELGKLEDYHRGEGMRLQKMLGDFYWDYTSQRKQIGDAIAEAGYAEITIKMLKSLNTIGIFKNDEIWFPAYYTYNTTWNYSDTSDLLARNLAEADAVRLLSLNCSHKPYITNIHSKNVFYVMKASMSILHNIARNPNVKGFFKENKTAEVIMPFINMNDDMLRVLAMLTLAYIVEEEDNSKLIDETGTIKNVVMWIGKALDNPKRRFKGFTPQELTQGLDKLAVNDGNKLKIIEEGSIPLFMKMLLSDNDKEQSTTARCVWTLAFDKDVRKELFETENMMSTLEKLLENQHKDVKKNAQGALWVLTGKGDAPTDKTKGPPRGKNHIFISYSWNEQEKVLEIRDKLRAEGYIVWVDVDEMGGSTLQAMAEAVENAAVVLVCMSEKYKQSPNCRTEAEYTFQLRKDYIPLMMQKKYRPDGWLGMILGAKLFFDFSGKYPFEKSMSGMLKELRGRGKRSNVLQSQSTDQVDALESTTENRLVHAGNPHRNTHPGTELAIPQGHQPLTHNMSRDDVQRWLVTHQLDGSIAAFSQFDGRLLWQLREMKQEAPDYFYQCLEKKLFMNLIDMLRLASALDTLH
ncbi:uncharacterized protein [Haliotis cracherodii]|uniref:uncharacterized protein isoform X2 n=1 Tax=Haliotis cracherodii TaxID=6455 RepID=UPI0039E7BE17